jgi:hypothetical protein
MNGKSAAEDLLKLGCSARLSLNTCRDTRTLFLGVAAEWTTLTVFILTLYTNKQQWLPSMMFPWSSHAAAVDHKLEYYLMFYRL